MNESGTKRRNFAAVGAIIALVAGGLMLGSPANAAPIPHAKSVGCHVVTVPPSLNWWDARCLAGITVAVADPRCFTRKIISC